MKDGDRLIQELRMQQLQEAAEKATARQNMCLALYARPVEPLEPGDFGRN